MEIIKKLSIATKCKMTDQNGNSVGKEKSATDSVCTATTSTRGIIGPHYNQFSVN